ncbi:MAG TPA: phospholipid carrier-dependent glycosyltransferase [Patescibacteria group bacterium]
MLGKKFKQLIIPKNLILSVLFVLGVRLAFSLLPSFQIDMGTWLAWAGRLRDLGFDKFYSDTVWTQYTPGYLYWLWVMGKTGIISEVAIKLPVILADIGVGVIIWNLVRKVGKNTALAAFFAYTLNPVVIFNGSVWGQIDGIFTLFLFLAVYLINEKKSVVLGWSMWAIAFLIKPQAFAILPFLVLITLKKYTIKQILKAGIVTLLLILALSIPFFPTNPIFGLPDLINKMSLYYPYTSVFAFNVWTLVGMWKADSTTFLGIQYFYIGIGMYALSLLFLFWKFRNKLDEQKIVYLVVALSWIAFFLFPTRVHERYLFPAYAFLITGSALSKSKALSIFYVVLSFLNFLNLYHPYAYYAQNYLVSKWLLDFTGSASVSIGIGTFLIFLAISFSERFKFLEKINIFSKKNRRTIKNDSKAGRLGNIFMGGKDYVLGMKNLEVKKVNLPHIKLTKKQINILLGVVIAFSFVTRVFMLANPPQEYFDEVYHAFTARQMLHGNKMAWEWWNTPPVGFAYEWTHPPLAKEGMVLGMLVFGENPFGWRIPGALLGVGSVILIYLIARKLFEDDLAGVLAAGVFSLDGLPLVLSRIGMNDSYFLFFALTSIYFYLDNKNRLFKNSNNFLAALTFGLSLASKWSALWAIPIYVAIHFLLKRKLTISYLWFLVLPPLVYVATYIPMFISGHNFSIFIEMQKQMWWYHTNLRATHPYTSPWWSWPFLVRPIWLYTSGRLGDTISNIYAMGNPVVFWFGLGAVVVTAVKGLMERSKKLILVAFAYLIFFVPWALSPRIMFLYHYLPSIPFLAIATGYVLRKHKELIAPVFIVGLVTFIYFYPHLIAMKVPVVFDSSYYWFDSWR